MCYLGMFEEGKAGDQEPGGGGLVVFPRERFSSTYAFLPNPVLSNFLFRMFWSFLIFSSVRNASMYLGENAM
jgi:hypothetical protein